MTLGPLGTKSIFALFATGVVGTAVMDVNHKQQALADFNAAPAASVAVDCQDVKHRLTKADVEKNPDLAEMVRAQIISGRCKVLHISPPK